MPINPRRAAFTLVELLVVIAIIGVMVAMLMPAVQYARETARKITCAQHLTQLSMGIQQYESIYQFYPAGTVDLAGPIQNTNSGQHFSWLTQILPYIDQGNAFKAIDRSESIYAPANERVRSHLVPILHCPTQGRPSLWSDYAACHHDVEAPIDTTNQGVFFLNSHLGYADITDGLSHTLFLGEKTSDRGDQGWYSGTRGTLRNTGWPITRLPFGRKGTAGAQHRPYLHDGKAVAIEPDVVLPPPPPPPAQPNNQMPGMGMGSNNRYPPMRSTSSSNKVEEPLPQVRVNPLKPAVGPPFGSPLYVGGFNANHGVGGMNAAFGDGSIRMLHMGISAEVLKQLGNRSDGELPQLP